MRAHYRHLHPSTNDRYQAELAARIHDDWRRNRGTSSHGVYVARIKVVEGIECDIANMTFEELPLSFQQINLVSARHACDIIDSAIVSGTALDRTFIERTAEQLHIAWRMQGEFLLFTVTFFKRILLTICLVTCPPHI